MTDEQDLLTVLEAEKDSDGDINPDELPEGWEVIEEDSWEQDIKYQCRESIVRHVATGRHFCISRARCGSYHSDWQYLDSTVVEVKPTTETITVTKWVGV